jgi:hypothetical protein
VKYQRAIVIAAATVITAFAACLPVFAADYGGGSVQGYGADRPIDDGTVVQLVGDNSDSVAIVPQSDMQNMFGVTVDPKQMPIRVSNPNLENEVFVAVSGTYDVLVTDQAGPIIAGDYLTLSSTSGFAMKAGTEEETVLGRAAGSFDGNGAVLGTTTLEDVDGNTLDTVKLGSVPVTIDIKRNPNETSTKTNVPDVLERIGQAIAEKEVNPIRIYLSMAITAVSLVTALIVLYSGVRNAVISIGRNPMSKKTIFRALLEIILTSLLILVIGMFAVYLLLRL